MGVEDELLQEEVDLLKAYEQLQQKNKQLKMINEEYERLNKEKGRGFRITNVQEYNIDELLSYKDNWNKLKEHFSFLKINSTGGNKEFIEDIILFMHELEQGSDNYE